jgi:chemotaxis signal transduction protein
VRGIHVRFRVGSELYAVPVAHVLEIAPLKDVTRVPGAQAALIGVWNRRGQILSVIDLARVLGFESLADAKYLLVVEVDGKRAALAVDGVSDVELLDVAAEPTDSELLLAHVMSHDELIGILDLPQLVTALERAVAR